MKYFKLITGLILILFSAFLIHPEKRDPNISPGLDSIKAHHVYDCCKTISLPKFAGSLSGH